MRKKKKPKPKNPLPKPPVIINGPQPHPATGDKIVFAGPLRPGTVW